MSATRSTTKIVSLAVALAVVVAGVLFFTLQHSSNRAFCDTMRRTLGADADRLNIAVTQSHSPGSSPPSATEIKAVRSLMADIAQSLNERPPVALVNYLYDYQARLSLAVSVVRLTNAEGRFHAFAVAPLKTTCPGLIASLAK